MAWNETFPDGSKSVKANESIGLGNTAYIKTTSNVDHFWNISGTNDGHHQFVQMPMQGTTAVPANATLATGMDGLVFCRAKTTGEVPGGGNQDVQPYFTDNQEASTPGVTQVMQLLGIRVCGVFTAVGGVITMQYSHNLSSLSRTIAGTYQANFPALPSNNYLVYGDAVTNSSATANSTKFFVTPATAAATLASVKATTFFQFRTISTSGPTDPLQCWFVVFGG